MTLPASELLGPKEVSKLNGYDPRYVRSHDEQAVNLQASLRLVDAVAHLAAAFGKEQRKAFAGHCGLHSKLAFELFAGDSADNSAQVSKESALNTPILQVSQAYLRELAAPAHVLSKSNVYAYHRGKEAYKERHAKVPEMVANLWRYTSSSKTNSPVLTAVGEDLQSCLSKSQQRRLSRNWPIATGQQAAANKTKSKAERLKAKEAAHFQRMREDFDVHGVLVAHDNVGKSRKLRFETTTQWWRTLPYSRLPASISDKTKTQANQKAWVPMAKSGLHNEDDLLASAESDELQRLNVILHLLEIDKALPTQNEPCTASPPTRATKANYASVKSLHETDYGFEMREDGALPRTFRSAVSAGEQSQH